MALDEQSFANELAEASQWVLGGIERIGPRARQRAPIAFVAKSAVQVFASPAFVPRLHTNDGLSAVATLPDAAIAARIARLSEELFTFRPFG